jgi:hypothetical protein
MWKKEEAWTGGSLVKTLSDRHNSLSRWSSAYATKPKGGYTGSLLS